MTTNDVELIREVLYDALSPDFEVDSSGYRHAAEAVVGALAGRLLPVPLETRTEWGATYTTSTGRLLEVNYARVRRETAESEVEALSENVADLPQLEAVLVRREIRTYADKSTWVGPWVPVDPDTTTKE